MKLKAYVHAQYCEYEKRYNLQVWGHDMTGTASLGPLVEVVEIDVAMPPNDVLVNGTIEMYRQQQKKVIAEAERVNAELQQRINDLLCIEYKPEVA